MSLSQWERFLKNTGIWQGALTQFSPQGQVLEQVLSRLILKSLNRGQLVRQEQYQQSSADPPFQQVTEHRTLSRGILFFENGAFSDGALQWGPLSDFKVELGLIQQDQRLRLVQLFDQDGCLKTLTLSQEQQLNTPSISTQPPLTISDLVGVWEGEIVTLYADYRPDTVQHTQLTIEQIDEQQIRQTIELGDGIPPISSTGDIHGSIIHFETGTQPVQVMLLPYGASSTSPRQIQRQKPFFLEVGWLIEPHLRQRMIRQYNAQGTWGSLSLVTELKR